MASELMEAIDILVKEKNISKEAILSAIESSLVTAYKNQYKKKEDSILAAENVFARIDEETGGYFVYAEKTVVEEVENALTEISLQDARAIYPGCEVGDIVRLQAQDKDFSRIATQNAKNVLLQNLRENSDCLSGLIDHIRSVEILEEVSPRRKLCIFPRDIHGFSFQRLSVTDVIDPLQ